MGTPIKTFHNIKSRCYNPKDKRYQSYGGKGITVCDQWLADPKSFTEWANTHGYGEGMELHRKNNAAIYSPETCMFLSAEAHTEIHSLMQQLCGAEPCTCLRCGATWTPRTKKPVQCPRCKRVDWDKKK